MNIAIIGAGAAGLSAAYDLTRAGHSVTVFEATAEVGGLAAGFRAPGWDWTLEKYYHHWFATDSAVLGLTRECGWADRVLFPRPLTVVYHDEGFYPLDSVGAVLRFPGLPFPDRLRLWLVIAFLKATPFWGRLEKATVYEWMRKWSGERAFEALWRPLLEGKFGEEHYREVNMAWMWARVHARTPRLGTFEGGFQRFMDLLAERVRAQGAEIRLESPVRGIHPDPAGRSSRSRGGLSLEAPGGPAHFDACIATTSPALLARLAPDLPSAYLNTLLALKSMGAVVLVLALDRQMTRFYWHNLPKQAGFPFLALVEHTNFIGREHYGGDHSVYLGEYLAPEHEYFRLSKEELLARFLPALKRFNHAFEPGWVKGSWLFKTPYAQPVPLAGHSAAIPDVKTPLPGLWLASMSQVYPWDRGTNFAVEIGRRVARRVMAEGE
ncbi:MAG: NAD(P)/FAD-dependent oxidoreductase [Chloroflexi bacterium]|nr:NAD(P)/FAD-dependent oxidoreductase [Chloroflexota bacterium]